MAKVHLSPKLNNRCITITYIKSKTDISLHLHELWRNRYLEGYLEQIFKRNRYLEQIYHYTYMNFEGIENEVYIGWAIDGVFRDVISQHLDHFFCVFHQGDSTGTVVHFLYFDFKCGTCFVNIQHLVRFFHWFTALLNPQNNPRQTLTHFELHQFFYKINWWWTTVI